MPWIYLSRSSSYLNSLFFLSEHRPHCTPLFPLVVSCFAVWNLCTRGNVELCWLVGVATIGTTPECLWDRDGRYARRILGLNHICLALCVFHTCIYWYRQNYDIFHWKTIYFTVSVNPIFILLVSRDCTPWKKKNSLTKTNNIYINILLQSWQALGITKQKLVTFKSLS